MKFEDEPVPGYPLPILPGHVSPGSHWPPPDVP